MKAGFVRHRQEQFPDFALTRSNLRRPGNTCLHLIQEPPHNSIASAVFVRQKRLQTSYSALERIDSQRTGSITCQNS